MKNTLTNIWLWFVAVIFTAIIIGTFAAMAVAFVYSVYSFLS